MALKFTVQEVTVENVVRGKNRYSVANVVHDYNGQNRTQKIMSFSNPAIFEQVKGLKSGDVINVEITKNDAGFNQWAKITMEGANPPAAAGISTPSTGKVVGSNYETKEERAARQVLIVRQSSLKEAVSFHSNKNVAEEDILNTAQRFADWVFEKPDLWDQPNDDLGDAA
jgi:hypothetical protein